MQEHEIIALFFARDEEALRQTQLSFGAYCGMIAKNLLHNEEDVKECVNDAYLDAWNTIPPQKPTSFKAYIGALCRHRAIDRLRSKGAQKRGKGGDDLPFSELEDCLPSYSEDVVDEIALRDALNSFLSILAPEARVIFMQRYWYAGSLRDIARHRGVSEKAVASSLRRSREKLRELLAKEGF